MELTTGLVYREQRTRQAENSMDQQTPVLEHTGCHWFNEHGSRS